MKNWKTWWSKCDWIQAHNCAFMQYLSSNGKSISASCFLNLVLNFEFLMLVAMLLNSVICNLTHLILSIFAVSGYPLSAAFCISMICQALAGKWDILWTILVLVWILALNVVLIYVMHNLSGSLLLGFWEVFVSDNVLALSFIWWNFEGYGGNLYISSSVN